MSNDENKNGKIIRFPAESIILQEGKVNTDMYKIIQGKVELYTGYGTDHEVLLGIIGEHSCFGEFGLLMEAPSIYTAIAFSDVYLLRVTTGEIGDFVQENHKNIIDIMRNMAHTMMVMQQQIDMLTKDMAEGRKSDEELIRQSQRNKRGYAVYNPNNPRCDFSGKYRFIDVSR